MFCLADTGAIGSSLFAVGERVIKQKNVLVIRTILLQYHLGYMVLRPFYEK